MGKVHKVIESKEDCVFKSSMKVVVLRERFVKSFKSSRSSRTSSSRYSLNDRGEGKKKELRACLISWFSRRLSKTDEGLYSVVFSRKLMFSGYF